MSRLSKKDKRRLRQEGVLDSHANFNTKNFSPRMFNPKTHGQAEAFEAWEENYDLMLLGCAGTGKTFLSLYFALSDIFDKDRPQNKLAIFRSAVATRDQGFQPGNSNEKLAIYLSPYPAIINRIMGRQDAYEILKQKGMIETNSTSFERGKEYNNTVMVVDECQNMTFHEFDTVYTRIGNNSKIFFCGDNAQNDFLIGRRREESGLDTFVRIADRMEDFDIIEFEVDDIIRSGKIRRYIETKHQLNM